MQHWTISLFRQYLSHNTLGNGKSVGNLHRVLIDSLLEIYCFELVTFPFLPTVQLPVAYRLERSWLNLELLSKNTAVFTLHVCLGGHRLAERDERVRLCALGSRPDRQIEPLLTRQGIVKEQPIYSSCL